MDSKLTYNLKALYILFMCFSNLVSPAPTSGNFEKNNGPALQVDRMTPRSLKQNPTPSNAIITSLTFPETIVKNLTATATTFKVCDKPPAKVLRNKFISKGINVVKHLEEYWTNNCTHILQGSEFEGAEVEPIGKNGFIGMVIRCYNGHHNLVIRPDDIWTAIISQFSLYINANPEKFRRRFVNFDGKKETLEVIMERGYDLYTVSYADFVRLMTDKIHENIVDEEVKNWIMPNFTTTTEEDKISAGVIFMATLKKYYNYVGSILCGIPEITIEGTVEDWENIVERLAKLRSYDLESWVDDMLLPIIQQFISAKSGKIDQEFWSSIVTVEKVGCGSTDLTGWITAFNAINDVGEWRARVRRGEKWPRMDIEDIVSGVVYVDVLINDNGKKYDTVMFAGHLGKEILPDGYTLQPKIGWAIAMKYSTDLH